MGTVVSVVIPRLNEERNIGWVLDRLPPMRRRGHPRRRPLRPTTRWRSRAPRGRTSASSRDAPGQGRRAARRLRRGARRLHRHDRRRRQHGPGRDRRATSPRSSEGYDLVKGSRFLARRRHDRHEPSARARQPGAAGARRTVLYGGAFTDLCYGYMALPARRAAALGLTADGFEIETQIVVQRAPGGSARRRGPELRGRAPLRRVEPATLPRRLARAADAPARARARARRGARRSRMARRRIGVAAPGPRSSAGRRLRTGADGAGSATR